MCKFMVRCGHGDKDQKPSCHTCERNGFEPTKFGKGSHRRYKHRASGVSVTIPGKDGDDAKIYLEKQVQKALKDVATGRGK